MHKTPGEEIAKRSSMLTYQEHPDSTCSLGCNGSCSHCTAASDGRQSVWRCSLCLMAQVGKDLASLPSPWTPLGCAQGLRGKAWGIKIQIAFLKASFFMSWGACAMAALEPRRLGAAAGVGAATKASDAAFSRAKPPCKDRKLVYKHNVNDGIPQAQPLTHGLQPLRLAQGSMIFVPFWAKTTKEKGKNAGAKTLPQPWMSKKSITVFCQPKPSKSSHCHINRSSGNLQARKTVCTHCWFCADWITGNTGLFLNTWDLETCSSSCLDSMRRASWRKGPESKNKFHSKFKSKCSWTSKPALTMIFRKSASTVGGIWHQISPNVGQKSRTQVLALYRQSIWEKIVGSWIFAPLLEMSTHLPLWSQKNTSVRFLEHYINSAVLYVCICTCTVHRHI